MIFEDAPTTSSTKKHLKKNSRNKEGTLSAEEYEKLKKLNKTMRTKFLDSTKWMVQFQFMGSSLKHLRSQDTLLGMTKCILDVKKFLMWKDASIWFLDPYIQRAFQREGGKGEISIVDGTHIERAVLE